MTLIAVREEFARLSGRHDLVTDFAAGTYTDNGANKFIKAGLRLLDRMQDTPKSEAWIQKDVAIGDFKMVLALEAVTIKEVWKSDADGRKELEEKTLSEIMKGFATPYADLTNGAIKYWAPVPIGLGPEQEDLTSGNFSNEFTFDFEKFTFGDHYSTRGILLLPPTDAIATISVLGRFHSFFSTTDGDKNYWYEQQEDIMVLACLAVLERSYRNTEGYNDWIRAIKQELDGIDKDLVEDDNSISMTMDG